MITNEALFEKLAEVQAMLSMQGKFAGIDEKSVQLWDLQDIADYCKVSYRQAQSITAAPYFPKAIFMPSQRDPNKPTDKPRWFAGEVVRYVRRRQLITK
ncbi:hypothetical protein HYE60_06425 [Aggregatibacter actinomycetemcomitans]|uniref:hypothetical protein n=1 Tax=Aggregatibacter actinomycetemcomitans TaxID=714 RepID=UPI00197BA811|nr:hypothetical protein [Aggregatibacter actinomycetemcomitans]MBN6074880.1 hypothetical protein [Aggregatibacter actinomycetemcomitans]